MKTFKIYTMAVALTVISMSYAFADGYPDYPVAPDLQHKYRSETFMNSGKGELVPNTTYVTCSTDLNCMRVGNNLYRVSRFKGSDFSKKSVYPLSPADQTAEANMNYWAK